MADSGQRGLRLLSVDGGGIRGLSSLLIIKRLMHRIRMEERLPTMPLPCEWFDMMAGTGTGGIIVLMLGRLRMSIDDAIGAFENLSSSVFSHVRTTPAEGAFEAARLEAVLKEVVSNHSGDESVSLLDDSPISCPTFVCAMNARNVNANIPQHFRTYLSRDEEPINCTIWQAARATAATQALFERVTIYSQTYVGGDLGNNNPMASLLQEAQSVFPTHDIACIVSIGTGHPATISVPNPGDAHGQLMQMMRLIAMDCERTHEEMARRFSNLRDVYFRFNVEQGCQGISTTQSEELASVEAHTQQYMRETVIKNQLDHAVEAMRQGACAVSTQHLNSIPMTAPIELRSAMRTLQDSMQDAIFGVDARVAAQTRILDQRHMSTEKAKQREEALNWLNAPPPPDPYKMGRMRHGNTGAWFLEGPAFKNWVEEGGSPLLLYGKPGSGKTVMCSTIIDRIKRLCESDTTCVLAAYYFDFRGESPISDFLRSLLRQLSLSPSSDSGALIDFHARHKNSDIPPSNGEFKETLLRAFGAFRRTYVIIDALDESGSERRQVLQWLSDFIPSMPLTSHLLMTSRRENDIRVRLERCVHRWVDVADEAAAVDIQVFVQDTLLMDPEFRARTWLTDLRDEIVGTLTKKAKGMFRWVFCQLEQLRTCFNASEVRESLHSLPIDLDETYERLLCQIDDKRRSSAVTLLAWLCFSWRPLTVGEAAEVLGMDLTDIRRPSFNTTRRPDNPDDVFTVLSSLLVTSTTSLKEHMSGYWGCEEPVVELAHYSVKEYLLSERIRGTTSKAAPYAIQEWDAHVIIAQTCLAYLRHCMSVHPHALEKAERRIILSMHDSQDVFLEGAFGRYADALQDEYPLVSYAIREGLAHLKSLEDSVPDYVQECIMALLSPDTFRRLYSLWFLGSRTRGVLHKFRLPPEASPLYFAAYNGLLQTASRLIAAAEAGTSVRSEGCHNPLKNGLLLVALEAAVVHNDEAMVGILLGAGVDLNNAEDLQKTGCEPCLMTAHGNSSPRIIEMLIRAGADVNVSDKFGQTLLHLAVELEDASQIIRILVEGGAKVDARDHELDTALLKTVREYSDDHSVLETVRTLLTAGACPTVQNSHSRTALHMLAASGLLWMDQDYPVAYLLLDAGVDVNIQDDLGATALHVACHDYTGFYSRNSHPTLVRILLDADVNVNARDAQSRTALHRIVDREPEPFGADIDAQDGEGRTALHILAGLGWKSTISADIENAYAPMVYYGSERIACLLLGAKADANIQDSRGETPLHRALSAENDRVNIVRAFLDAGADPNIRDSEGRTTLHKALSGETDTEGCVRLLLGAGADVNIQDSRGKTPLHKALSTENDRVNIVRAFLDAGADPNVRDSKGRATLHQALSGETDTEDCVRLLLGAGADANIQDGRGETPLHKTLSRETDTEGLVHLLLDSGADINICDDEGRTALHRAILSLSGTMVDLLINRGANPNLDYQGRSLLDTAVSNGWDGVIRILRDAGGGRYYTQLHAAVYNGYETRVRMLLNAGEDHLAHGGYFISDALQGAAFVGSIDMVRMLLAVGADVNAARGYHGTALEIAMQRRDDEIVQLLWDAGAWL